MTPLQLCQIGLALGGLVLGISCLFLVHCSCRKLSRIGRRLFMASLVALGAGGMIAAMIYSDGLAPLGLLAGLLVVAMLWEWPAEIEHSTNY